MSRTAFEHAYRVALRLCLTSEMLSAGTHQNLAELALAAHLKTVDVLTIHQLAFHELLVEMGDRAPDYQAAAVLCQTLCDALQTRSDATPRANVLIGSQEHLSDVQQQFLRKISPLYRGTPGDDHFLSFVGGLLTSDAYFTYFKDVNGVYELVNPKFSKLMGIPAEHTVGKTVEELFSPEIAVVLSANDQQVMRDKQFQQFFETVFIDNQQREFISIKFPVWNDRDEVIGAGGISTDVTEIIEARIQAETRHRQLDTIFNAMPCAILIMRMDGAIEYSNRAAEMLFQMPESALRIQKLTDFLDPDLCRKLGEIMVQEGRIHTAEQQLHFTDGRVVDVIASAQMIEESNERKIIISLIDISEKKRIEAELESNANRFRIFAEQINDMVSLVDPRGVITYVNKAFERALGYRAEEMIGARVLDMIVPEDQPIIEREYISKAPYTEHFTVPPYRMRKKDWGVLWVESAVHAIRNVAGEVESYLLVDRDVTEQQSLIHQLRINEQRYHALFDKATDAVFLIGLDQRYIDFNQSALNLLGFTREELFEKKASDVTAPDENEDAGKVLDALLNGQHLPPYMRTFITKEGRHLTCEISVSLVRDNAGNPLYIQSIVHDVTHTRELLASLSKSRYFVEQITHTIPDTIYLVDVENNQIVFTNRSLAVMLGYDELDSTAESVLALVHPDDLAAGILSPERFQAFDSDRAVIESEFRVRNANGSWSWIFVRETPFERDDHGKVTRVLAVAQNFTQRKELEFALKLTRRSVDVSNVGITIADARLPDMPIVAVNPAFCKITGYSEEETLGRNCRFLQGTETDQECLQELRLAIREGRECKVLLRNFRKDGRLFYNELHVSPIYDDANQLMYFVGVQTDITEIIETQQKIQEALQLAQDANQLKNRFISMVSHEFRTPLAVIRSTAETLRDYYDRMDADQRRRRFMNIDVQVARVSAMLEDLLTLGKLENTSLAVSQEAIDLNDWLESLLEEFMVAHQSHRVVSQIDPGIMVIADRILLRQILTNLLSNAIKYSGASNLVELTVRKVGVDVRIVVRDYGIGIPPDDLGNLFQEFKRASNVGTIQGTGLGLVIVHRAVTLHGGEIDVQSALGTGTTITISMPVVQTDALPG